MEAVPLAEAAMVPAVPLEVDLPVARAIMAAGAVKNLVLTASVIQ